MTDWQTLGSIPLTSIVLQPATHDDWYLQKTRGAPRWLLEFLSSQSTGAYIRGLAKTFDVPVEQSPKIAFSVLQIAIGEKTLAELPALLMTALQIPTDKAQLMAQEIDQELFAPIKAEWEQYLATRQTQEAPQTIEETTEQNVLDLTKEPPIVQPPPSIDHVG